MPDIVIVAGETSGDQLAADLVERVRALRPEVRFHGVTGPRMRAAGVESWLDSEVLAVRGYAEVLSALPRILKVKSNLIERTLALRPALYIGVDAPDFNLRVARALKARGTRTLHYVCPSFWAWRPERAARFPQAVDHMLCLFPFEPALLAAHGVDATFVGHPLASAPMRTVDRAQLRQEFGQREASRDAPLIAVLPGSRVSEVELHRSLFVDVIQRLARRFERAQFLVPLVTRETRALFETTLWQRAEAVAPRVKLVFGHADRVLRAADVALVASGTATLEAAMLGCPQVVSYRVSALTAAVVKRKLNSRFVSLPNIIADDWCVPELLQDAATVDALESALSTLLLQPRLREAMQSAYEAIGDVLQAPAAAEGQADPGAAAVLSMLGAE